MGKIKVVSVNPDAEELIEELGVLNPKVKDEARDIIVRFFMGQTDILETLSKIAEICETDNELVFYLFHFGNMYGKASRSPELSMLRKFSQILEEMKADEEETKQ